jgi:hypothetical protein
LPYGDMAQAILCVTGYRTRGSEQVVIS